MISKIKNMLVAFAAVFAFAAPVAVPGVVFASDHLIRGGLCNGVEFDPASGEGGCDPATQGGPAADRVSALLRRIINIFSWVVGVIAVIMIIVGGLRYITSGGDSGNVSSAKNTILYALVGLVIVALAQFIVRFVLTQATTIT
ncbi:MAG TPA: pilin [Candidatus Saccharimonadales bacterium]|nr:pilin [Candidatus Saccharimonadales bacterium]